MTERSETCANCRWFDSFGESHNAGYCRAHAPRVYIKSALDEFLAERGAESSEHWPVVERAEWCGEWRETKEAEMETIARKIEAYLRIHGHPQPPIVGPIPPDNPTPYGEPTWPDADTP